MTRRARRLAPTVLALALAALAPRAARADDAAEARLHFELGNARFQAGNYEEALTHFLQAYRLAPTTSTAFNIAQAYLVLHREPEAYRFFSDFLARPDGESAARAVAERAVRDLEPRLARISVRSMPEGATIFIDRPELGDFGLAPRVIAVAPGAHEVILRMAGHLERRERVDVVRGQQVQVALELEPLRGALRVTSEPPGATVFVDDAAVAGTTPLTVPLTAGAHRVRLRRTGYLDVRRDVTIDAAGAALEERLPRDLASAAVLSVRTTQPGALVFVRGARVGTTPYTGDLLVGSAVVRVEQPGRAPFAREVLLRPGRAVDVRVVLGDPRASRPAWIPAATFGGAAVVVAGAILGGVALGTHASFVANPERDTLDRTRALNVATDVTLAAGLAIALAGVLGYALTPDPRASRGTVHEEGMSR